MVNKSLKRTRNKPDLTSAKVVARRVIFIVMPMQKIIKVVKIRLHFKIKETIRDIETIATGPGIKNLNRLNKIYGKANWRKLKGICHVELEDGAVLEVEVYWYEGHGIGKKEIKIKKYL